MDSGVEKQHIYKKNTHTTRTSAHDSGCVPSNHLWLFCCRIYATTFDGCMYLPMHSLMSPPPLYFFFFFVFLVWLFAHHNH